MCYVFEPVQLARQSASPTGKGINKATTATTNRLLARVLTEWLASKPIEVRLKLIYQMKWNGPDIMTSRHPTSIRSCLVQPKSTPVYRRALRASGSIQAVFPERHPVNSCHAIFSTSQPSTPWQWCSSGITRFNQPQSDPRQLPLNDSTTNIWTNLTSEWALRWESHDSEDMKSTDLRHPQLTTIIAECELLRWRIAKGLYSRNCTEDVLLLFAYDEHPRALLLYVSTCKFCSKLQSVSWVAYWSVSLPVLHPLYAEYGAGSNWQPFVACVIVGSTFSPNPPLLAIRTNCSSTSIAVHNSSQMSCLNQCIDLFPDLKVVLRACWLWH